jgi:hypothetical protein
MARGTWGGLTDPNLFKVAIRFQFANNFKGQTGFKLRDLAVQDNTCESVANAVVPWVNGSFRTLLNQLDTILAVDVIKMGTDEGFTHLFDNTHGTVTVAADVICPSYNAVNIALRTQLRKRYGQGRMFWPVRRDDDINMDTLNAQGLAAQQGALDALMTAFSGSVLTHDLVLVNAHKVIPPRAATASTPARPEIPPSWYDVESVKVNTAITSLRSRKVGIGS